MCNNNIASDRLCSECGRSRFVELSLIPYRVLASCFLNVIDFLANNFRGCKNIHRKGLSGGLRMHIVCELLVMQRLQCLSALELQPAMLNHTSGS